MKGIELGAIIPFLFIKQVFTYRLIRKSEETSNDNVFSGLAVSRCEYRLLSNHKEMYKFHC